MILVFTSILSDLKVGQTCADNCKNMYNNFGEKDIEPKIGRYKCRIIQKYAGKYVLWYFKKSAFIQARTGLGLGKRPKMHTLDITVGDTNHHSS